MMHVQLYGKFLYEENYRPYVKMPTEFSNYNCYNC